MLRITNIRLGWLFSTLYGPGRIAPETCCNDHTSSDWQASLGRVAHAGRGRHQWLLDRDARFWAAILVGLFPDADIPGIPLGSRSIFDGIRHPEFALGYRTTIRRRRRRSFRRQSRDHRRCRVLCAWPRVNGTRHHTQHARSLRRRADRTWIVRLLVQPRDRCFRQAAARTMALACFWCRHGRRLVRPISLFADWRGADG